MTMTDKEKAWLEDLVTVTEAVHIRCATVVP